MAPENITADSAAEALIGTCKPIHEVCKNGEYDDPEFCKKLDRRVMPCECCGWWCWTEDISTDGYCEDCITAED